MMTAVKTSETWVSFYQTTWRNISADIFILVAWEPEISHSEALFLLVVKLVKEYRSIVFFLLTLRPI